MMHRRGTTTGLADLYCSIMTHIHRLLNELLIRIFHAVYHTLPIKEDLSKSATRGTNAPELLVKPEVALMQLVQVCRRWRGLICGERRLWSIINVYHDSNWLALSLDRASCTDLLNEIDVYFRKPKFEPVDLDLLLRHASFLRSLSFNLSQACFPCISALFTHPLPVEELSLTWRPLHARVPAVAYIDLCSERLPHLRSLTLTTIPPMGAPSLYSGLRNLNISNCMWNAPLRSCLDMLAACANLENLVLRAALSHLSDAWSLEPQPYEWSSIVLPRLRTLTMAQVLGINRIILSYLRLPAATSIRITDDISSLSTVPGLSGSFSSQLPEDATAILPFRGTIGEAKLVVEANRCYLVATSPSGANLQLTFMGPWQHDDLSGLSVRDLAMVLAGAPVMRLSIEASLYEVKQEHLRAALVAFPQLRRLRITGHGEIDYVLCDALRPVDLRTRRSSQGPTPEAELPCPVPNLENLVIGKWGHRVYADEDFFIDLKGVFRVRAERGSRLKSLDMYLVLPNRQKDGDADSDMDKDEDEDTDEDEIEDDDEGDGDEDDARDHDVGTKNQRKEVEGKDGEGKEDEEELEGDELCYQYVEELERWVDQAWLDIVGRLPE